MSFQCLSPSFSSNWLTVWEEMWFEEFRDGRHGGYIEYQNGTILAFLNLNNTSMPPISSIQHRSGAYVVSRFSRWPSWRGGHLGYLNATILAILNFHLAPMLPTKFLINPTRFWRRCQKCEKLMSDGRTKNMSDISLHCLLRPVCPNT